MKSRSLFAAAIILATIATTPPSFAAEKITFDPAGVPEDYATNLKATSSMSISEEDGSGVLSFRSFGGGELLLMQNDGNPLEPAGRVEMELRVTGQVTLGVFLRGNFVGDEAYLAFFSASPDGTIRLSLSKSLLEPAQRPSENAFVQKHTRGFGVSDWVILRFSVEDIPGGGVGLRASVVDPISDLVMLEVDGEDEGSPLLEGGTLGLRFFTNRSEEENGLDIRSITVGE